MGEIADMMLDGTLCAGCGEAMEAEDLGFSQYCSTQCAKDHGADPSQVAGFDEAAFREERRQKKLGNEAWSINHLKELGFNPQLLNEGNGHYRVGTFDFWPRTGKYRQKDTKVNGRGVRNLVAELKKSL